MAAGRTSASRCSFERRQTESTVTQPGTRRQRDKCQGGGDRGAESLRSGEEGGSPSSPLPTVTARTSNNRQPERESAHCFESRESNRQDCGCRAAGSGGRRRAFL